LRPDYYDPEYQDEDNNEDVGAEDD